MQIIRSVIQGVGSALPRRVVPNSELELTVDTTDEWIIQRTGIRQRYIVGEDESTVSLGVEAANRALLNAHIDASEIDLIIVATSTPDNTFPASAVEIQHKIGNKKGFAFDIQAVCSGFVYAISTADMYIRSGMASCALVIGADTFSRIIDWKDRTTCVLFGDGAGAVVLKASEGRGNSSDRGILTSQLRSDGSHKDKLFVDGGPSSTGNVGQLRMKGQEVFKHAVSMVSDVIEGTFAALKLTTQDLDWLVPHQANERIIQATAKKFNIPLNKVVVTVDRHANTSAASIPLALSVAVEDGRIQQGDLVMLEAMGGGFTWGAVLLRW